MFKKRIKKSRATWLGLLLRKGNSRSKLRKHHSERGIAIPLVIGIGLLMMLLSITVIVRSQSSQINTSNLKQAAIASEVTETGLARIQEIFQLNPWIATVGLTAPSPEWKNLAEWKENSVKPSSSCPPPGASTASTVLNGLIPDAKGWFDIETGKRQFRVVSYTVNTANQTPPTTGTLKLEGRFIDGNESRVLSTSALQVTIPVSPGDINSIPIPGVWAGSTWDDIKGDGLIKGDVIFPCSLTDPDKVRNPGYQKIQSNLKLPALPTPNPPALAIQLSDSSSVTSTTRNGATIKRITDPMTLPISPTSGSKTWESNKVYEYEVADIDLNGQEILTIDPNYRVTIHLTGNIGAGGSILHTNGDTTTGSSLTADTITVTQTLLNNGDIITFSGTSLPGGITAGTTYYVGNKANRDFKVYTNAALSNLVDITTDDSSGATVALKNVCDIQCLAVYKPTDFKIYGYGTNSATNPPQICVNGNRQVDGFIFAPSYAIGRTGSANYYGSIWVNGFMTAASCGAANNQLVVTQTGTWSDINLIPENLPPSISASQTWTKIQAQ